MYEMNDLKVLYTMVFDFIKVGSGAGDMARFAMRLHRHILEKNCNVRFSKFEKDWIIWQTSSDFLSRVEKIALNNLLVEKDKRIKNYFFLNETIYVNKICDILPLQEEPVKGDFARVTLDRFVF